MNRRGKLSNWHPGTRRFRTRVLRYLQARIHALEGISGDYVNGRISATRSILNEIERMR